MIYRGYTEHGTYHNIRNLSQASLNKWPSQILVKATVTKRKLTSSNPKLTWNPNLKPRQVCFVKFICLSNVSDYIL